MFQLLLFHLALLPALWPFATAQSAGTPRACNNSPSLCARPYSNITHLGAHNSPFVRDASTSYSPAGNQHYNTTVQLDAGVRLVSAQVHLARDAATNAPEWHLCHTSCALLDAGPLAAWLRAIAAWLDAHPADVVTLLLVNTNATAADLAAAFDGAGLARLAYAPAAPPAAWPALGALVDAGTRLVAFVAGLPGAGPGAEARPPYLLDEFALAFENAYGGAAGAGASCAPDRPAALAGAPAAAAASGRLFLQNHFFGRATGIAGVEVPDEAAAGATNAFEPGRGGLGDAARTCQGVYERAPNFLLVDWFEAGPAVRTVDALNGVTDVVGRRDVGARAVEEGGSAGASGQSDESGAGSASSTSSGSGNGGSVSKGAVSRKKSTVALTVGVTFGVAVLGGW